MFSILHIIYAMGHIALAVWALRLYRRQPSPGILILAVIALGLSYDNLIVGLGEFLGIGATLHALSIPRFLIHAFLTPFLLFTALSIVKSANLEWANKPNIRLIIWAVVGVLIVVGVMQDNILNLNLQPACHSGTIRYVGHVHERQVCADFDYGAEGVGRSAGPPLASIATIIGVIIIGGLIWRRRQVRWMLLGAVIMFITAAVPASIVGLWVANTGELVLIASMCMTAVAFMPTPSRDVLQMA